MAGIKAGGIFQDPGTAAITGASAGIGLAFAGKLAEMGFKLILVARRQDRLEEIASRLEAERGIACRTVSADLSRPEDAARAAELLKQVTDLDLLVNNAGFGTKALFADVEIDKSIEMLNVHAAASMRLAHAALQVMRRRKRGGIINVASMAAFGMIPGNLLYSATKSFLLMFSEGLRLESANDGIAIQALCPGFTRTEFHEVGDLKGFDKSAIPAWMWMPADDVAALSLKALGRKLVFVPGAKNRFIVILIRLFRPLIRALLMAAAKKNKAAAG